jgi:hypothetical protein
MSNNNSNQGGIQRALDLFRNTTVPTTNQTPSEKQEKDDREKEARRPKNQAALVKHPISPINAQRRDKKFHKHASPVTITFLDGDYAGQDIELGLAIEEISQEQTAEWSSNAGKGIRAGANFNGISTRTFTVKLTFHDVKHDISHLVENLAHLHEIGTGATTPPTLIWKQGALRATRVICTSFSPHYQHPMSGKERGFRYCEVELKFQLLGGKSSSDALAPPLTSTPLQLVKRTTTVAERTAAAAITQVKEILNPCITGEGSDQLVEIIKKSKQRDERAILALPHNTFVQAAVGGIFSKTTLEIPAIAEKLKRDLALVLAENEGGIQYYGPRLANALISGDASGLPEKIREIFDGLKEDYELILGNIKNQQINENAGGAFDQSKNQGRAFKRFTEALGCGLDIRNKARIANENVPNTELSGDDKKALDTINEFLKNKPSDEEIKEAFGVKTPEEIKVVRKNQPYTSKENFVVNASRASEGLTGHNLWDNFIIYHHKQEGKK